MHLIYPYAILGLHVRFMQKQKQKQKKLNMSDLDSSGKFPMFFCLFVLNIHLGIFISVFISSGAFGHLISHHQISKKK